MKAVLVIEEMPKTCLDCPLNGYENVCNVTLEDNYDYLTEKPSWCPLKPLPTKITTATLSEREQERTELFTSMALLKTYADGWNDCLEEIQK